MSREKFDVVILGGGNAGIGVTGPVRRAGMSVAMIEARSARRHLPEPRLHAEESAGRRRSCAARDRTRGRPSYRRRQTEARLGRADRSREGHDQGHSGQPRPLDGASATSRSSRATPFSPAPTPSASADRELEAKHIVIATGSKPRPLPIPGAELMITSDEMLSERDLPASVIFVGGGVISLEFGHVYARAGTDVTILEALPQLLPAMDADAVARLQTESERIGIRVKTGVSVKRIEPANGRLRVIFTHDGTEHAAEADRVVNGAGRVANVDTLDLAAGNVEHANGRVAVDRHLRSTSNPLVHVCGDAVPTSPQLSPIATYEGDIVGRNIVEGPKYSPDYASMATSVYTVPRARRGRPDRSRRQAKGPCDRRSHQRHARLVLRKDLCRDRRLVEDHRRRDHRPHSRRAFRRTCRPGTGQPVRPRDALRHHGRARSATTSTPIRRFPPTSSTCSRHG